VSPFRPRRRERYYLRKALAGTGDEDRLATPPYALQYCGDVSSELGEWNFLHGDIDSIVIWSHQL
jgi:hypothetical protein